MFTLGHPSVSGRCLRAALHRQVFTGFRAPARGYALSRHPPRGPGSSRAAKGSARTPRSPENPLDSERIGYEERPSVEESPLWEASQRPPASNPAEGLHRLLMENDRLVITREIEMLNIFMGFEQTNRYSICNEQGEPLGYIAEEPRGLLSIFSRQILRTHRPFRALIMDLHGSPILWIRRPFAWINSRMFVQRLKDLSEYTPEGEPVLDTFGEVQQRWHLWRRRYDLFLRDTPRRILSLPSEPQPEPAPEAFSQYAKIDEGLLAWHFNLYGAQGQELASVNRAFRGFGREIFTDTGQYFVQFGPRPPESEGPIPEKPTLVRELALEERAITLALAVNVDFDYFSRHSEGHGGGMGWPIWFGSWGDE